VPLLVIVVVAELISAAKDKKRFSLALLAGVTIAVISLVLILPALIPAFGKYYETRSAIDPTVMFEQQNFYPFSWDGLQAQTGVTWFLWLALGSLIIGWFRKPQKFSFVITSWLVFLLFEGFSYLLKIPLLSFTNLSAVLIMLYLPISLAVGNAAQNLMSWIPKPVRVFGDVVVLVMVLACGIWGTTLATVDDG
jgi:hypothetical protein